MHLSWDLSWGSLEVSKKVYHLGVGLLEDLVWWGCKIGLQKICQIVASECRSMLGIMRGFQKGKTLGGRISGRVNLVDLQYRVAKKFANFLHLSWDSSQGS